MQCNDLAPARLQTAPRRQLPEKIFTSVDVDICCYGNTRLRHVFVSKLFGVSNQSEVSGQACHIATATLVVLAFIQRVESSNLGSCRLLAKYALAFSRQFMCLSWQTCGG